MHGRFPLFPPTSVPISLALTVVLVRLPRTVVDVSIPFGLPSAVSLRYTSPVAASMAYKTSLHPLSCIHGYIHGLRTSPERRLGTLLIITALLA